MRKAAREHKEMKFTALLHHLTVDLLRESFDSECQGTSCSCARVLLKSCVFTINRKGI